VFPEPGDKPFAYIVPQSTSVVIRLTAHSTHTVHLLPELLTPAEIDLYLEELVKQLQAIRTSHQMIAAVPL
jgi:hypothetical protein